MRLILIRREINFCVSGLRSALFRVIQVMVHIPEAVPMRITLIFLIALFAAASGPARADNPYAVAGISNPAHVTQFLARLK